jgi:hypothetical protein
MLKTDHIIKYTIFVVIIVALLVIPHDCIFGGRHNVCLHRKLFHFGCPLCGMTRAAHEIGHFRIHSALGYNFNIVFLPLYLVCDLALVFTGRTVWLTARKVSVLLLLTGLIILYIFRFGTYFGWFV